MVKSASRLEFSICISCQNLFINNIHGELPFTKRAIGTAIVAIPKFGAVTYALILIPRTRFEGFFKTLCALLFGTPSTPKPTTLQHEKLIFTSL